MVSFFNWHNIWGPCVIRNHVNYVIILCCTTKMASWLIFSIHEVIIKIYTLLNFPWFLYLLFTCSFWASLNVAADIIYTWVAHPLNYLWCHCTCAYCGVVVVRKWRSSEICDMHSICGRSKGILSKFLDIFFQWTLLLWLHCFSPPSPFPIKNWHSRKGEGAWWTSLGAIFHHSPPDLNVQAVIIITQP